MSISLTSFGHACVRVTSGGTSVVVDPGAWSDPAALDGADAVLVTHDHQDHLDLDAVHRAKVLNPGLRVWGPPPVVHALTGMGAGGGAPAHVRAVEPGDSWTVGGITVEALGGDHAVVHPDLPGTANIAYLIGGAVLHPGDSFTDAGRDGVEVLLVPVGGPWLRIADAVELVRAVRPRTAVPIHDAVLSDAGRGLADRIVGSLGGAEYRRLAPGETLTVG